MQCTISGDASVGHEHRRKLLPEGQFTILCASLLAVISPNRVDRTVGQNRFSVLQRGGGGVESKPKPRVQFIHWLI